MVTNGGAVPTERWGPHRVRGLLVLVAVVLVVTSSCRWGTFRYDPALSGYNDETGLSAANGAQLTPTFSIGVGWTSPVVVTPDAIVGKSAWGDLWGADRAGTSGCSGVPRVCQPLWTAPANTPDPWISLHGGTALTTYRAETNGSTLVAAFDVVGRSGCSGTPVVCSPTWVTDGPSISGATVKGSSLYVTDGSHLRVYDADGTRGCAGSPRICSPMWTAAVTFAKSEPMVVDGRVYVADAHGYQVFDAAGSTSCSGAPKVCTALWSANLGGSTATLQGNADWVVAVTGGTLQATDATGTTGCTGTPKVCSPVWTAAINGAAKGRPSVAQGKVLIQADSTQSTASAYDLAGVSSCTTGALPHRCTPVWTRAMGPNTPTAFDITAVNDVAFFARYDGTSSEVPDGPLYAQALRIDNGTVAFSTPDGLGFMPPTVGDGRVYLQNPNGIQVLG